MSRNRATRRVVTLLAVALLLPSKTFAQTGVSEPSLREKLVFGLQVRRPSEFDFVDAVVDTVERGELPQSLVERFFFFARTRPQRRNRARRPIIDFQFALTTAATKLGISIKRDATP